MSDPFRERRSRKKQTTDILAAIAYEKRMQKWSMRERQLYRRVREKISEVNIEFFRWLKSYLTGVSSRKSKSEVLRELGNIFLKVADEMDS